MNSLTKVSLTQTSLLARGLSTSTSVQVNFFFQFGHFQWECGGWFIVKYLTHDVKPYIVWMKM